MNDMENQILSKHTISTMKTASYIHPQMANVKNIMTHRQIISLTFDELLKLTENKSYWFYESDIKVIQNIDSLDTNYDESIYEDIDDATNISEYVGVIEKYFPDMNYIHYCKTHNKNIIVNVYDGSKIFDTSKRIDVLRDKIHGNLSFKEGLSLPSYQFTHPDTVIYSLFNDINYNDDLILPSYSEPVHVISFNVPYQMYCNQPLNPNTYVWDSEKNDHFFGGMTSDEFEELFNKIIKNGIIEPLFMRLEDDIMITNTSYSNMMLFIAKILKIPSIPVVLYLTKDDMCRNCFIEGVLANNKPAPRFNSLGLINNSVTPYLFFNKTGTDFSINANNTNAPEIYTVFSVGKFITTRYLDHDKKTDGLPDYNTAELEKLQKLADATINDEIEKAVNELLGRDN